MTSRRDLLIGASALAIATALPDLAKAFHHGSASSVTFGKINLSVTSPGPAVGVFPFLNMWKMAANLLYRPTSGPQFSTVAAQGYVDMFGQPSAFGVYCDSNGEQLSTLPANVQSFSAIIYQCLSPPSFVIPQLAGNTLTVDWTGGANWECFVQYNGVNSGGNLGTSTTSPMTTSAISSDLAVNNEIFITFLNLGGGDTTPPQNIRVYLTKNQADINAGKLLDPDYVAWIKPAAGSIRYMTWLLTVNNQTTNGFSTLPTTASNFWGTPNGSGQLGIPLAVIVELCNRTNKPPHFCWPANIISPKVCQGTTITRANPAHVTTFTPNPYVNGDLVILNSFSGSGIGIKAFTGSSYATSTFTAAAHGMVNGYPLQLGIQSNNTQDGSTYPSPINKGTYYYACNVTTNTFQIASSQANGVAGTNIALTGSMTGTINIFLQTNFNTYTVANASSTGFDLSGPGSDTSTWNFAFATASTGTATGNCASPLNLSYIETQVGLIDGYFQAHLNSNLIPIYEYSNEVWNIGTGNFFTVNAQSLLFSQNVDQTSGYIQAAIAKALRDSRGGSISQVISLLLGRPYQDNFTDILIGINAYISANAPTLTIPNLFNAVLSINTYQGTVSYWPNGASVNAATVTFGANTIAFSGATTGLPIKLNTGGGGTLPSGLTAGVLGTAPGSPSNAQILKGSCSGTTLTVGLVFGTVLAGAGIASPSLAVGTTIVAQLTSVYNPTSFTGSISGTALTTTTSQTLNVGDLLTGSGVTAGTHIVSGSGTAWVVDVSQTVGAGTALQTRQAGAEGTYQISTSQTISTPEVMNTGPYWTPGSGQIYWLVGAGPTNFGLATSPGGSALTFTTAGVTGTNTATQCGAEVVQFLIDTSISNHNSSPGTYPTKYTYYNQSISDDVLDARWTGSGNSLPPGSTNSQYKEFCIKSQIDYLNYVYTNWTGPGKPLAGLPQTSYEGGNNNPANGPGTGVALFPIFNDPTWRDFFFQAEYCQGNADNLTENQTLLNALPGGFLRQSQFLDINTFNYAVGAGAYGASLYVGDSNPRWQGVIAANNM